MLFNSIQFVIFFIIIYLLYLLLNHKWQNRMLLLASYIFYASWDWRFLSLLLLVTLFNFHLAQQIAAPYHAQRKKTLLVLTVILNLTVLGFFKYFNFFTESFTSLINLAGWNIHPFTLNILLPLGISFFTFQIIGYIMDVYRGQVEPEPDLLTFALFEAYFPQLIAGPIERANNLLVQFRNPRAVSANQIIEGLWLILWGYFMKVFMADNLATTVSATFKISSDIDGLSTLIGVHAFAFQILGDFAGYSSIAIGVSKLMGITLMTNFLYPYFVTNPRDLWRNWHISFTTWLRDYVYIPLGGNRGSTLLIYRNIFLAMLLGGLWHGAKWTFVLWGAYHGVVLVIYYYLWGFKKDKTSKQGIPTDIWTLACVVFMFEIFCLSAVLFRSESLTMCASMLHNLFCNFSGLTASARIYLWNFISCTWLFLLVHYLEYRNKTLLIHIRMPFALKVVLILLIGYSIVIWGEHHAKEFIYFQF